MVHFVRVVLLNLENQAILVGLEDLEFQECLVIQMVLVVPAVLLVLADLRCLVVQVDQMLRPVLGFLGSLHLLWIQEAQADQQVRLVLDFPEIHLVLVNRHLQGFL